MSSLLEFQHTLVDEEFAIYSIETGELNPEELETEEMGETRERYHVRDYSLAILRKYIQKYSSVLAETGNVIKGEIIARHIILTVLKTK